MTNDCVVQHDPTSSTDTNILIVNPELHWKKNKHTCITSNTTHNISNNKKEVEKEENNNISSGIGSSISDPNMISSERVSNPIEITPSKTMPSQRDNEQVTCVAAQPNGHVKLIIPSSNANSPSALSSSSATSAIESSSSPSILSLSNNKMISLSSSSSNVTLRGSDMIETSGDGVIYENGSHRGSTINIVVANSSSTSNMDSHGTLSDKGMIGSSSGILNNTRQPPLKLNNRSPSIPPTHHKHSSPLPLQNATLSSSHHNRSSGKLDASPSHLPSNSQKESVEASNRSHVTPRTGSVVESAYDSDATESSGRDSGESDPDLDNNGFESDRSGIVEEDESQHGDITLPTQEQSQIRSVVALETDSNTSVMDVVRTETTSTVQLNTTTQTATSQSSTSTTSLTTTSTKKKKRSGNQPEKERKRKRISKDILSTSLESVTTLENISLTTSCSADNITEMASPISSSYRSSLSRSMGSLRGLKRERSRESLKTRDFDIDNIVVPFSVTSIAPITPKIHKDITIPQWKVLDSNEPEPCMTEDSENILENIAENNSSSILDNNGVDVDQVQDDKDPGSPIQQPIQVEIKYQIHNDNPIMNNNNDTINDINMDLESKVEPAPIIPISQSNLEVDLKLEKSKNFPKVQLRIDIPESSGSCSLGPYELHTTTVTPVTDADGVEIKNEDETSQEDTSDEAYAERHFCRELLERNRLFQPDKHAYVPRTPEQLPVEFFITETQLTTPRWRKKKKDPASAFTPKELAEAQFKLKDKFSKIKERYMNSPKFERAWKPFGERGDEHVVPTTPQQRSHRRHRIPRRKLRRRYRHLKAHEMTSDNEDENQFDLSSSESSDKEFMDCNYTFEVMHEVDEALRDDDEDFAPIEEDDDEDFVMNDLSPSSSFHSTGRTRRTNKVQKNKGGRPRKQRKSSRKTRGTRKSRYPDEVDEENVEQYLHDVEFDLILMQPDELWQIVPKEPIIDPVTNLARNIICLRRIKKTVKDDVNAENVEPMKGEKVSNEEPMSVDPAPSTKESNVDSNSLPAVSESISISVPATTDVCSNEASNVDLISV